MKKIILFIFLITIAASAIEQKQEGVGWLDIFAYDENSKLDRILLIGDSIVNQYAERVRNQLKGHYILTRFSTSKSICSNQFLKQLDLTMDQKYAMIFINNGLHAFSSTDKEYKKCFKQTLDYLIEKNPKSEIFLVATTPVKNYLTRDSIVRSRNRILKELSKKYGIGFVDLYSTVSGKSVHMDKYHFRKRGVRLLSEKIIITILNRKIK